jgi:hypothetical protein
MIWDIVYMHWDGKGWEGSHRSLAILRLGSVAHRQFEYLIVSIKPIAAPV